MAISRKLKSRKFLLTLGVILFCIGGIITGDIPLQTAILRMVQVIAAYVGAEGIADALGGKKGASQ